MHTYMHFVSISHVNSTVMSILKLHPPILVISRINKYGMADHSGYKMHTYVLAILPAYLKYLNEYVLTTNVSAYVKYVNTFACQNYFHKIVLLCIFMSTCHKQICRAQVSYVNSFDTQMYWHILHMQKHLRSIHIYLNILNMLKNS
jgi:vesicle coat complex subunit